MIDNALMLKDAGAMIADGHCTVDDEAQVIDLGTAPVEGHLALWLDTVKVSAGNETYKIYLEFNEAADGFATDGVDGPLVFIEIDASSDADVLADMLKSPQAAPFGKKAGYRYARLYVEMSGTSPSIDFRAYLTK